MLLRITSAALLFSILASAQTLTLVSGNGQLISYGSGAGVNPIVFSIMNGSAPVANQTITFTNSDGTPASSMLPQQITTGANGTASSSFYPAFIGDADFELFPLQAHYGSQVVSFNEGSAEVPPTQLTLTAPAQSLLTPLTAKAGQSGPVIEVTVEAPIGGPIPNVAVQIIPVETGVTVPAGGVVETATCLEAGTTPEGKVFTNSSGVATCTPVFTYPNSALSSQYDKFTFNIAVGGPTFHFGPFPYNISPAPLTISGPPQGTILLENTPSTLQITGTGGVPPYTFSLAAGSGLLPGGLTLNANGSITGSSNTPGLFPFKVILTDHTDVTLESQTYSIAISGGAFADSPANIPDAVVGQPYSETISITGGVPPYTLSLGGTLAPGLIPSVSASGLSITISGTPTAISPPNLGIKITDSVGNTDVLSLFGFQSLAQLLVGSVNTQSATVSSPFQLQVPISGGLPPYTVTEVGLPAGLSINSAGLVFGIPSGAAGVYPVTVSVTDSIGLTASGTLMIDVTTGPLGLGGSTTFPSEQAGVPFSQPLSVSGGVPPYTFAVTTAPDQTLSISPAGILTGTFNAAGNEVVNFSVTDSLGTTVPESITITVLPGIGTGGITSSASFLGGSIAPGEIVSIFGSGLGPDIGVGASFTTSGLISTMSGNTQVMFGAYAAPILYASSTQLNVVVPFELVPGQNVAVTVTTDSEVSMSTTVPVAQAAPGIFLITGTQAAVLNQDLSVNGSSNPAADGSIIVVYATGGGVLSSTVPDGTLPSTLINVANTTLTVGGQPAKIDFAGLAPGLAGVIQINATLPAGITSGPAVPIVLSIAGVDSSAQTATIAVQ